MPRLALLAALAFVPFGSGCSAADADGAANGTPSAATRRQSSVSDTPAASTAVPVADRPDRPAHSGRREIAVGDWPQFLGPHGTGRSDETGLARVWPADGPPTLWSKRVGVGYSAPSILGDRLVLHHRDGDEEIVECFDAATGETKWRYGYGTEFVDPYGYNGGPRCTPLLTSDRCYTFGASGMLACVELETGKEVWRRQVTKEFQVPEGFFGIGASPVLYGNLLIVLVGGQPDAAVVAFDKGTGETVWHAVGKPTWDGAVMPDGEKYEWTGEEMLVSYSAPLVATIDGEDHLLCLLRQGLVSLDPQTGRTRFRYWFRSQAHESVNAARPVVVGDTVLLTAAYRTGAALLRLKTDGYDELWRDRSNLECHWSTPIAIDGYAYGFSGRHEGEAMLRCVELATGKVVWEADGSEPVRDDLQPDRTGRGFVRKATGKPAPWPFFGRASMTLAEGRVIILGERGTLFLAKLTPEGYDELSRATAPEMDYPAWPAPALSRGRLYLRDEDALVCLDVSKKIEPSKKIESSKRDEKPSAP